MPTLCGVGLALRDRGEVIEVRAGNSLRQQTSKPEKPGRKYSSHAWFQYAKIGEILVLPSCMAVQQQRFSCLIVFSPRSMASRMEALLIFVEVSSHVTHACTFVNFLSMSSVIGHVTVF
jgi:hypothetical protein